MTLLLALVVVVPTVALVWLVKNAVESERLASRQRLFEAYHAHLASVERRIDSEFRRAIDELDNISRDGNAQAAFATAVAAGRVDTWALMASRESAAYPVSSPSRNRPAGPDAIERIRVLEVASPLPAAAAYEKLAASASEPLVAALALQSAMRVRGTLGEREKAIELAKEWLTTPRFEDVTDSAGRLLYPSILLYVLEKFSEADLGKAASRLDREQLLAKLEAVALRYDGPPMSSAQRLFLLHELDRLKSSQTARRMLQAETLALTYLENAAAPARAGEIRRSWIEGIWIVGGADSRWIALFRTETLARRIQEIAAEVERPQGMRLAVAPPTVPLNEVLLSASAGSILPGWQIGLSTQTGAGDDGLLEARSTWYYWIAGLAVLSLIGLVALSLRLVRHQLALTQLRSDLVANVSHELKTPLASMRLFVDSLLEGTAKDERTTREYLQLISRENLRLSRLIDNFLTFSRIERNKYVFNFESCAPEELGKAAFEAVEERFRAAGCEFNFEADSSAPRVTADFDAIVTSLVNLLDNALKYTGEEKQIRVSVSRYEDYIRFAVTDNGIGLSPGDQKRIFRRFYQVNGHLGDPGGGGGCGLGLSIVEFVVKAHRGRVGVESELNHGSTFFIDLPSET